MVKLTMSQIGLSKDIFRPTFQPARAIYDAFQAEADKRDGRSTTEWITAEREAVWKAARDQAGKQSGLRIPTMEEVENAECNACGHADYGAKWAYGVADAMLRKEK